MLLQASDLEQCTFYGNELINDMILSKITVNKKLFSTQSRCLPPSQMMYSLDCVWSVCQQCVLSLITKIC